MEQAVTDLESYLADIKSKAICASVQDLENIIYEIDSSLNYIHDKGIAHLDLSTANILKNNRGHWVLADFGFSRELYSFDYE